MAITLEANYSKKIGLPSYSSHQFSLTLRAEVTDINSVQQESTRLYSLLQTAVDQELQHPGFVPGETVPIRQNANGNGHSSDQWNCSDKQKELILKIVEEHHIAKTEVEQLAQDRFSKQVKKLNKLEASGLIEELLERTGQKKRGTRPAMNGGSR